MTEKLARRGLRVHAELEVDVLRTTLVRDVMSREVETLPAAATVGESRRRFEAGRHGAYPLVNGQGRCVGIVSRGDVLRAQPEITDEAPVSEIASRDVVAVTPGDTVHRALQRMLEEGVEHLPVIDGAWLVGICTRTDVLRARRHQLELERLQTGWSPLGRPQGPQGREERRGGAV
jgi:CBS domain-containing protein